MSQKYVVAHFVKSIKNGHNFSCKEWPLHVTLLPNFIISDSLEGLTNNLDEISHLTTPFSIKVGDNENFGLKGEIPVSLIKPEADVLSLHSKLLAITKVYEFDTPQYIGGGYRPHAIKQANSHLVSGKSHLVDSMTLVDMYPNNDIERREAIKTFYFK